MTNTQTATYKAALKEARAAFDKATKRINDIALELNTLADESGRLRRTITALAALCSESPGFDDMGITDSCMEVMESEKTEVTSAYVVKMLEKMGFDISPQKNASASVHAILSRLARNGKITKVVDEKTKGVTWRGPNFDPSYIDPEDIPF